MGEATRVFLSSTWVDLQPERQAVEKALHRLRDAVFSGMEYFGSRPETPADVSLAEVDRSDVYVGIFAHRYGSGITEAEYRRAGERGLPCLIYIKDDGVAVPDGFGERDPAVAARLEALHRELKQNHAVSRFRTPEDLATQVVADLHNLLGKESGRPAETQTPPSKYQITIGEARGVVVGDHATVQQVFGQDGDPR